MEIQCLLFFIWICRGAERVFCVDVSAKGELDARLRHDPRVVVCEGINVRHLSIAHLGRSDFDVILCDLSFISLTKVLERLWLFLKPEMGLMLLLVKPQFEISAAEASRCRGIVRDEKLRRRVLQEIEEFCTSRLPGAAKVLCRFSPVKGKRGNVEYFLALTKRETHSANASYTPSHTLHWLLVHGEKVEYFSLPQKLCIGTDNNILQRFSSEITGGLRTICFPVSEHSDGIL